MKKKRVEKRKGRERESQTHSQVVYNIVIIYYSTSQTLRNCDAHAQYLATLQVLFKFLPLLLNRRFLGIFVVDDIMIVGNRREQYSMDQKCNVKVKVENDEEIRKKKENFRGTRYIRIC